MKKLLLLIILILFTSGCYNYKELSNLAVVSSFGIDFEDNLFTVHAQIINVSDSNSKIEESPISVISSSGNTIIEAAKNLNSLTSKILFISNIEYVLLSEEVVNNKLEEVLDYLSRDTRLSLNYMVITTSSRVKDVLETISKFDLNSSTNLSNMISMSEDRIGNNYSLSIKTLLNNYLSNSTTLFPSVVLVGDKSESSETDSLKSSSFDSYIKIDNMVFFDNNKNRVSLSKEESLGYNFLNNNITNGLITVYYDGSYSTLEVLSSKFSFGKLSNNTLSINGSISAKIISYNFNTPLDSVKSLNTLEEVSSKVVVSYIRKAINKAIEHNSDFIGITSYLNKNYYNLNKSFKDINYKYIVDLDIRKTGNLRGDLNG